MIIILQFLLLLLYSCWIMRRAARGRSAAEADQRAPLRATVIGLDDDSLHRPPASRGAWTALDERQLIQLLKDSAP
jgi:hypothetical protein